MLRRSLHPLDCRASLAMMMMIQDEQLISSLRPQSGAGAA